MARIPHQQSWNECHRTIPNYVGSLKGQLEVLVSDQCGSEVQDASLLTYTCPLDRGFVTDWSSQGSVLHRLCSRWLSTELHGAQLALTAALHTPPEQAALALEALFEAHGVAAVCTLPDCTAAAAGAWEGGGTGLVLQAGHSAVTATPHIRGVPVPRAATRVNVGGKALRNALAAALSKREVDLTALPGEVEAIFRAAAFVHPIGGGALEVHAGAATLCCAPAALAPWRNAYLRHAAPGRKGVCNAWEVTTWAAAFSAAVAGDTLSAGAAAGAAPAKRPRTAAALPNAVVAGVPQDFLQPQWLAGYAAGSEEAAAVGAGAALAALVSTAAPQRDDGVGLGVTRQWVLPDYVGVHAGFLRGAAGDPFAAHRQAALPWVPPAPAGDAPPASDEGLAHVTLGAERFTVPELLFAPSRGGLLQGGLAAAAAAAVAASPPEWRPVLWGQVLLSGGLVQLPGMQQRVQRELRAAAPAEVDVAVTAPPAPAEAAWRGLAQIASDVPTFAALAVTKARFEEEGVARCIGASAQAWAQVAPQRFVEPSGLTAQSGAGGAALLAAAAR